MCSQTRIWDNWPQPPTWLPLRKHAKRSQKSPWSKIVEDTKGGGPATYASDLPISQHDLEWQCFRQGIADPDRFQCTKRGVQDIAIFWMHCGFRVGASDGEETEYMIVKFQLQGAETTIHGYPVTEHELRTDYGVSP